MTDARIVIFTRRDAIPEGFVRKIEDAGGELVFALDEIGVAVVRDLSVEAFKALEASADVLSIAPDVLLPVSVPYLEAAVLDEPRGRGRGDARGRGKKEQDLEADPASEPFFPFLYGIRQIKADLAIAAGFTGEGATIGIIDTGIYYLHPDLDDNFLFGLNFFAPFCGFDPGALPSTCDPLDPIDDNGHGSHVSGTVAAEANGEGVIGVAPDAKLIAAKVCGRTIGCPTSSILAGIVFAATQGVDAMNISIGGFRFLFGGAGQALSFTAFLRATNFAHSQGSLIVNSAGNNGIDLDRLNGSIKRIMGEAANVMVVSALGPFEEAGNISGNVYTNTGNSIVDVAAPGGSFPPLEALILSTWSPLSPDLPGALYVFGAGTSFAAPHATGAAAQVVGRFGSMNPSRIRTHINQTADDLGPPGNDPLYGKGRVNVFAAIQ